MLSSILEYHFLCNNEDTLFSIEKERKKGRDAFLTYFLSLLFYLGCPTIL